MVGLISVLSVFELCFEDGLVVVHGSRSLFAQSSQCHQTTVLYLEKSRDFRVIRKAMKNHPYEDA